MKKTLVLVQNDIQKLDLNKVTAIQNMLYNNPYISDFRIEGIGLRIVINNTLFYFNLLDYCKDEIHHIINHIHMYSQSA